MEFDRVTVGERLFVGSNKPEIFGRGPTTVNGTAAIEGPQIVGDSTEFIEPIPTELGSLMVGRTTNIEMKPIPFYSLVVKTYARIKSFLKVDTLLSVETIKSKIIYTEVLMAKTKNFIINHPTKPGKQLIHSCLEGPENGVYVRGRITNKKEISLPEYWTKLVNSDTITVQLQPIGAHQNVIVKRIGENKIFLQSNGGIPIDCYYHIFAERNDVEKLIIEVNNAI
jgi:hypothetical protein